MRGLRKHQWECLYMRRRHLRRTCTKLRLKSWWWDLRGKWGYSITSTQSRKNSERLILLSKKRNSKWILTLRRKPWNLVASYKCPPQLHADSNPLFTTDHPSQPPQEFPPCSTNPRVESPPTHRKWTPRWSRLTPCLLYLLRDSPPTAMKKFHSSCLYLGQREEEAISSLIRAWVPRGRKSTLHGLDREKQRGANMKRWGRKWEGDMGSCNRRASLSLRNKKIRSVRSRH